MNTFSLHYNPFHPKNFFPFCPVPSFLVYIYVRTKKKLRSTRSIITSFLAAHTFFLPSQTFPGKTIMPAAVLYKQEYIFLWNFSHAQVNPSMSTHSTKRNLSANSWIFQENSNGHSFSIPFASLPKKTRILFCCLINRHCAIKTMISLGSCVLSKKQQKYHITSHLSTFNIDIIIVVAVAILRSKSFLSLSSFSPASLLSTK